MGGIASDADDPVPEENLQDVTVGMQDITEPEPTLEDVTSSVDDEEFHICEGSDFINLENSLTLSPDVLNEPLAPNVKVTKFEALLMVFHLALRHGMTWIFLEDMLKFVNKLVDLDNAVPRSRYLFQKLFMCGKDIDVHFYCPNCESYLGHRSTFSNNTVTCECGDGYESSVSSLNGGNYFVTISIKYQLQELLMRPDLDIIYTHASNRRRRVMSDIYDGKIYRELLGYCERTNKNPPLTITFNTDGSPVFKSTSKSSLWPIQFILNEISPRQRFNQENVMLAGLWFGKSPNVDVFFKPFIDELNALSTDGLAWRTSDGSIVQTPVFGICCVTDSAARPKVQKHHLHNGSHGCGYCLHPGISTVIKERTVQRGNELVERPVKQLRYLAGQLDYTKRSDAAYRMHMAAADRLPPNQRNRHVFGVLGTSPLHDLSMFDLVYGFSIDYLHAVLEGAMKKLFDLFLDSTSHGQRYYLGRKINDINTRLLSIRPPSSCRQTRPLSDRCHYKANDWRAMLYFYCLIILCGILPEPFFSHLRKLVTAIYILSKESVTYDEIDAANVMLRTFVSEYEILYGEKNMVYNVHLLLHLGKITSMVGPLWTANAFCFESGNGRLVNLVKGTTGVPTQIATKYQMSHFASKLVRKRHFSVNDDILDFCSDVVSYKLLKKARRVNNGNITLLGTTRIYDNSQCKLQFPTIQQPEQTFFDSFNRAVKDGILYHAGRGSKQSCFNDSCVKLANNRYAVLEVIFTGEDDADGLPCVWCVCKTIRIPNQPNPLMAPHIKEACLAPFDPPQIFPFNSVKKKCLLMCCDGKYYVSEFPNTYEKD